MLGEGGRDRSVRGDRIWRQGKERQAELEGVEREGGKVRVGGQTRSWKGVVGKRSE